METDLVVLCRGVPPDCVLRECVCGKGGVCVGGGGRGRGCTPPPPCRSYANVHNYYGPYANCSLDKGVACAQHIQPPTHTCAGHMC